MADEHNAVHRVRTLLRYLPPISELKKEGVLPKETLFPTFKKGGVIGGPTAKTVGYDVYGIFMEKIIELSIGNDPIHVEELLQLLSTRKSFKIKPEQYNNIIKMTREHFKDKKNIKFQEELLAYPIVGHPDIVTEDTVYDIKTAYQWNSMRIEATYQVLAYYCLAQKMGMTNISHIGMVMPIQGTIIRINMKGAKKSWNWEPFYDKMIEAISLKNNREKLYAECDIFDAINFHNLMAMTVGYTLSRSKEFENFFKNMIQTMTKPFQMFVSGKTSFSLSLPQSIKTTVKNVLTKPGAIKGFVHSSYGFNLSNPWGERREGEEVPALYRKWKKLSLMCIDMGISGVVIHTGKIAKMNRETALKNMFDSVTIMAQANFPECKMLIETPAGQEGELLSSPEELASFYLSLSNETKKNVAICVDTCHIFVAGYDIMEYISILESFDIPIELIHYNDSKMPKGSRRDRHAAMPEVYMDPFTGEPVVQSFGYIGVEQLSCFLNWALNRGVPLVHE
jgi:deoxyribonuclease-4